MRRKRRLRPIVQDALRGARHELLGPFADQAHHLRARFVVETPRGQDLGNLFPELAVALQSGFDILAYRGGQSCL